MNRRILNGWKQISQHLDRGVRTAQRWESQLGMPVHRPALKDRSAVVAFSDELELWLCRSPREARDEHAESRGAGQTGKSPLPLSDEITALARDNRELVCQTRLLREQLRVARKVRHTRIGLRIRARATPIRATSPLRTLRSRKRGLPLRSRLLA